MGFFDKINAAIKSVEELPQNQPDEPTPVVSKVGKVTKVVPDKVPSNAGVFTTDRNVHGPDGQIVGTAKTGTGGKGSTHTRPVREILDASLDSEESRNIAKLQVNYTAEQIQAIKGLSNAPATSQFLCGDL